jgi:hypothetical protein
LSTDTVEDTKEVNSSKITREITFFNNPVFKDSDASVATQLASISGAAQVVDVTLEANNQFVNRELVNDDFIFEFTGLDDDDVEALKVERLTNTSARVYGFPVTASGTYEWTIAVAAKAYRIQANDDAPTVSSVINNSGIATVAAANRIVTSGAAFTLTSGISFTISLSNTFFKTSGLLPTSSTSGLAVVSGTNILNASGIQLTIGGAAVGSSSGLTLIPQFADTLIRDSGLNVMTFNLVSTTGVDDFSALGDLEIGIEINPLILLSVGTTMDVLRSSNQAVSLQSRPRLNLEVLAE